MNQPALQLVPSPDRLALRVREMLSAGRPAAARPMLRVLRGLEPGPALLAELEARLALTEGRNDDALAMLSQAIADLPGEPGLHACRAETLLRMDRPGDGLSDAADAVVLAPNACDAKVLLGVLLIEVGRDAEAAICLADALQREPANASYRIALAEALDRQGHPESAVVVLQDGIRLLPQDLSLRRTLTLSLVRQRRFDEAIGAGNDARRARVVDASLFGLIGHAYSNLGQHESAAEAYGEALKLEPGDPYVRHLVAASGGVPAGDRAPAEYVRAVFDGYAERFEQHLLSLGYRGPGLLRQAMQRIAGLRGPVTDLGCGTGLVAVACDDLAGPWTGVDLSPRMLDEARAKGLYEKLVDGDVGAILPGLPPAGLVVAGDLMCYFGELAPILAAIRSHLGPGGHAVLTFETLDGAGEHAIRAHGRFAHAETYVKDAAAAAGFAVLAIVHDTLRRELGQAVAGMIVTLQAGS